MKQKIENNKSNTFQSDDENASPNILDIIAHHRHDSMNHLQVIYGYVTMKKYERIIPYIQKVTEGYQQESKLSQLGMLKLSEYLLTYNALHKELSIETQFTDNIQLPVSEQVTSRLQTLIFAIVDYYEQFGQNDGTANLLQLHIDQDDVGYLIEVTFRTEQEHNHQEPFSLRDKIVSIGGKIVDMTTDFPTAEWDIHLPFIEP